MVKFMTNTVKVGKSKSFAELVAEKTAVAEKVVKTASAEDDDNDEEKDDEEEKSEDQTDSKVEEKEAQVDEEDSKTASDINVQVENDPKVKKEEKSTGKASKTTKKKGDEAPSSGQLDGEPNHQKGESQKPSAVTCENKKTEASKALKFVKIAKLDGKTRAMLKTYWSNLYPAAYVEAMLTEK